MSPRSGAGNAHPNIVPYETFETADGVIAVAVGSEWQWPRFCDAPRAARTSPRTDGSPRTATASSIEPSCDPSSPPGSPSGDSAAWLAALEAADVPCGPIRDIVEAFASPEATALGMTVELEHPAWGVIRQVGVPFALQRDAGVDPARRRPRLGQDTDEVLAGLGYTRPEIDALQRDGVI